MAGEEGAAKRKADADGPADGEAAKRQRVDGSNGAAPAVGAAAATGGAAPAPKKLGIDLEKLQRAKEALRKQKELAERLKKAGVQVRAAAAAGGDGGSQVRGGGCQVIQP